MPLTMKQQSPYVTENTLNETLAAVFGKLIRHFDHRFDEIKAEMQQRTDEIRRLADAAEQRAERAEHEALAIGAEVDRHETWIRRVSDTASRSI